MKKINVGITIYIKEASESLFSNGIKQNLIIMRDVFNKLPNVEKFYYINFGPQKDLSASPWREYAEQIIDPNEALNKLDLIICSGVLPNQEFVDAGVSRKIKFINQILGNEYYSFSESVIFKNEQYPKLIRQKNFLQTWISPHLYEFNKHLFEVLYDSESVIAPYVWSPKFIEHNLMQQFGADEKNWLYAPSGEKQKRISIFEPNISMVKTCITPLITVEKLHRKHKDILKFVNIFGTEHIRGKKEFIQFAIDLDINKDKKIFFEDRHAITHCLKKYSDIVLSHQQDCALNYLYLDAAWLGYPVVHNAEFLKGLGWYYDRHEVDKAVAHLAKIAKTFDQKDNYKKYLTKSREYISQFLPEHPRNVEGYGNLIENLFK